MGQYYKAIILNPKTKEPQLFFSPHDWDNGAKLMEHSWRGNALMHGIENLIAEKPQYLVWAGDYAEPEENGMNLYEIVERKGLSISPLDKLFTKIDLRRTNRYLLNHTKKEYLDLNSVSEKDGWKIHPLSLLTAEGNGQGGGDYKGINKEECGRWARNLISATNSIKSIPSNYKQINIDFHE
jgi:hypothetical protein